MSLNTWAPFCVGLLAHNILPAEAAEAAGQSPKSARKPAAGGAFAASAESRTPHVPAARDRKAHRRAKRPAFAPEATVSGDSATKRQRDRAKGRDASPKG